MRYAEFVRKQYQSIAASATVTNTVTETAFDKTRKILANTAKVGESYDIDVYVKATATNSTDTLTVKLKLGTTVIATTGAVDVANSDVALIKVRIVVRTVGATGTIIAYGIATEGTPGTATMKGVDLASTVVDFTADQTLSVTATWSVANAGNVCQLDNLSVEHRLAPVGN